MDSEQPRGPGGPSDPRNPRGNQGRRGRRGRHRRPNGPLPLPQNQPSGPVDPQNLVTLEQRCHRYFPRRARDLGHDYFKTGRVSEPVNADKTFTVSVLGSGPSYAVVMDYSKTLETKSAEIRCECPYYAGGGLCKHCWAALLKIDKLGLNVEVPGTGPLRTLHVKPRLPGEQRPRFIGEKPVLRIPIASSWRLRLDQIQRISGGRPANTFVGTWLAYFVINAAETISSGRLVLDLWSRDRLASGGLGVLRPNVPQDHELDRFSDVRDQEVLSLLLKTSKLQTFAPSGRATGSAAARFIVDPILESHLIPSLASAGKLFLSRSPNGSPDDADRPLRMDSGKAWDLQLEIEAENPENYRLGGVLKSGTLTRSLSDPLCVFNSSFLLFNDRIGRLANSRQVPWVLALRSPEDFMVPRDQMDAFLARVLVDPAIANITWPEDINWTRLTLQPTPKGVFRPLGNTSITGRMTLTVSFDYAGRIVSLDDTTQTFVDVEKKCVYSRNPAFEEQTLIQASRLLRDELGTGTIPTPDLHRAASELTQEGWTVYIENQRLHVAQDYAIDISSNTDWFDLKMQANFAGSSAGQPLLLAALAKDGFVRLADGSLGALPQDWISRYASLNQFAEKNIEGGLRFNKSQGLMLHSAIANDSHIKGDSAFIAFAEKVRKFEGVTTAKAPAGFKGKLRNYQKEGLSWLQFSEEFNMGGVLADDMGLGKTIQILAFLKGRKKIRGLPSIVIAPKSLVFNWIDEAKRFVPELNVVSYSGVGRLKSLKTIAKADLVVTTYGAVRTDIAKLQEMEFDVAIIDEAQAIKNPQAQAAMAVKLLRAGLKLALTGTPIENSLTDLFSILEFTSPGLINIPTGKELSTDGRSTLSRMLKPFVLRRTKEKVLKELPEKSEQVLYCEMSTAERDLYSQLRDHYRASLTGQIESSGLGKSKIHVLEALLRLRQASCHPGLINPEQKAIPSAKLSLLLSQIQEVIEEGHKALVFSQFTSLLALVRETFDQQGIVYEYLDGQTVDRKAPVERFQTDPACPVFLISLKAGGTGLNLTAADYVFILDPWWNPAVEAQAIGRAHRIGQANKVFAYRMITRGTVEEKIIELQKTKRELAESVFSEDGTSFMKKLTREDLEMLLT